MFPWKKRNNIRTYLWLILGALIFFSPTYLSCFANAHYVDGIYQGNSPVLSVEVKIESGEIIQIDIVEYRGHGDQFKEMIKPLAIEAMQSQSLEFDAITGATLSSNNFKEALKDALKKAQQENSCAQ